MTDPFFTVVIPTYNRQELLKEAITSVLDQKFSDFELIIIDDGSTDNTQEVVNGFNDSRIRYVPISHSERSAARNEGIRLARGKYLCFLDDDDMFLEHHLSTFYNYYTIHGYKVFYSLLEYFDNDTKEIVRYIPQKYTDIVKQILQEGHSPLQFCIPKVNYKKLYFRAEIIYAEDFLFIMSLIDESEEIIPTNKITIQVRSHKRRSTYQYDEETLYKFENSLDLVLIEVSEKYQSFNKVHKKDVEIAISKKYNYLCRLNIKTGRMKEAFRCMRNAIRLSKSIKDILYNILYFIYCKIRLYLVF